MTTFHSHPDPSTWENFVDDEATSWPKKDRQKYWIIPSICSNCESGCGILAYINKETLEIRKVEGNPLHPGSRGRLCANGVATVDQLNDPDRILYPMRRKGVRGSGEWERVSWDDVLDAIAERVRAAILDGRKNEVMHHGGGADVDAFATRALQSWGMDAHSSDTNLHSSAARLGHFLWTGDDRPSPDYARARCMLLLSAPFESSTDFNPHAQRIVESHARGAALIVIDPRLSNTAAKADVWMPAHPGTEGALLLAIAKWLIDQKKYNRTFVRRWVNWQTYLTECRQDLPITFDAFEDALKEEYAEFTLEYAEAETGVAAHKIVEAAEAIAAAGTAFSAHSWSGAAAAHFNGWQITRALYFLIVLMGAVGEAGGVNMEADNTAEPAPHNSPPAPDAWSELLFPKEFPLAFHEMSFLLPHFLKEGRARLDTYFTRSHNPLSTHPDGFTWMDVLQDESRIGCHVAMTPFWNETALLADYVLPMGLSTERHDIVSRATHAAQWIGFRQSVQRSAMSKRNESVSNTYDANPGEVWEESEFWIALSWKIDPDGWLGIRQFFESPRHPGRMITADEYYSWIFDHSVPGLPAAAKAESLTPIAYMRRYGVFEIESRAYSKRHEQRLSADDLAGAEANAVTGALEKHGAAIGLMVDGLPCTGFNTPSRRLEFFSPTLASWGWPEQAIPKYAPSHVHWRTLDRAKYEFDLLPNFRPPTMIDERWRVNGLDEISQSNPLWIATTDAERLEVSAGDLVRVTTRIGYFIVRAWVTEGLRPGVVAMPRHAGRWRLHNGRAQSGAAVPASITRVDGRIQITHSHGGTAMESDEANRGRVWWNESGVQQNLAFPVQPDPVSGMHCRHQRVTVERAGASDNLGDMMVDTDESHRIYLEWMAHTRPAPGPDGARRPRWFDRPVKPTAAAYRMPNSSVRADNTQ